ncbi:ethylene-responsive transcription factor RAP2-1-like [Cryptomeria japonica]|uniref:ethylene-responsive transcription factor RAP2-1-like n=1 Tax=Cryptomeria japonica TaxID=3369 RepID=UPI0025ABCA14|nr:ethylene-responsive transcription factor RAP2-1-like [Cryptomeria japonica]
MRYRGVRKRKWGKYVAEIRSGKRSRISLGSYFTAQAAARAYDAALLCLRGTNATRFNFPDSKFNSTVLDVLAAQINPSPDVIRTAAIAVGSAYDTIPPPHDEETGPSTGAGRSVEEEATAEAIQVEEEDEEENDTKYLLQSPEHRALEESVQMAPLQLDLQVVTQPYDESELFGHLDTWDATTKR